MREEDDDTNELDRRLRAYYRTEDRELEAPPGLWDRLSPRLGEQPRYGWAQRIGAISLLRPLWSAGSLPRIFEASGARKALAASMVLVLAIGVVIAGVRLFFTPLAGPSITQVESVSPTEVTPGLQVDITGKTLGSISEAHLTKGLIDKRIFLLPISDTRLIVIVPVGVEPEQYNLELKVEGEDSRLFAGGLAVVASAIPSPDAGGLAVVLSPTPSPTPFPSPSPIVFANLTWDSARLQNAIGRFIVEKGYGYPTDTIPDLPVQAGDVWESLLTGNIQVDMEVWLPGLREEWETALEHGSVIPLGKSLDRAWQSAFVVPTYMIEGDPSTGIAQTPGLRTVQDLRNYAHVFAKPGSNGKAVLWNCLAVWTCSKINEKQVRAYGLADVIQLRDPGSDEELFNKVLLANESQLPWLGYMWGPNIVSSTIDLTRLEEPSCQVGMLPEEGCGYDDSQVRIAVHPSLVSMAPDVVELLRKWDFKESTQFAAEECLEETQQDFDKAAVCYLKNEQAVWSQWMPPEVAKRVRDALRKE